MPPGIAAIEAAQDVIGQMKGRAALLLEASDDDIEFADGSFTSKSNPGSSLTFKQVAEKLRGTGGFVIGQASVDPTGAGGAFAVHMADVEVDPETGKTEVLRYTAIQDAGKAVHPSYVEGQMQGGVAQGVGYAINEEYFYDEQGQLMNHSLLDYRMPTDARRADDRHCNRRGSESGPSIWSARCRRGPNRTAATHASERDPKGNRHSNQPSCR